MRAMGNTVSFEIVILEEYILFAISTIERLSGRFRHSVVNETYR